MKAGLDRLSIWAWQIWGTTKIWKKACWPISMEDKRSDYNNGLFKKKMWSKKLCRLRSMDCSLIGYLLQATLTAEGTLGWSGRDRVWEDAFINPLYAPLTKNGLANGCGLATSTRSIACIMNLSSRWFGSSYRLVWLEPFKRRDIDDFNFFP